MKLELSAHATFGKLGESQSVIVDLRIRPKLKFTAEALVPSDLKRSDR